MTPEEVELIDDLGRFSTDPYSFALWAFPWGEAGTELAEFSGPEGWQADYLMAIRDGLMTPNQAILSATTSGHGVGKSALVGMIVWWAFSTREKTRGVITANTENQLKTKTWVEIAKWYRLFIARHLFKCTATAIFSTDEELAREWRIDIVPWSEKNTEAFAGLDTNSRIRLNVAEHDLSLRGEIAHPVARIRELTGGRQRPHAHFLQRRIAHSHTN